MLFSKAHRVGIYVRMQGFGSGNVSASCYQIFFEEDAACLDCRKQQDARSKSETVHDPSNRNGSLPRGRALDNNTGKSFIHSEFAYGLDLVRKTRSERSRNPNHRSYIHMDIDGLEVGRSLE